MADALLFDMNGRLRMQEGETPAAVINQRSNTATVSALKLLADEEKVDVVIVNETPLHVVTSA